LRISAAASEIDGAVATVGQVEVEPGGVNVIPGRVRISVDARAPDSRRLERLVAAIGFEPVYRTEPIEMSEGCLEGFRAEVAARDFPVVELASGAGHDAGILAGAGVDAGMLFVRSLNGGVSHCPEEHSSEADVALAVDVLTALLRRLASAP
jgi:N-carbamoyl-L-amino-acid hydrolase